MSTRSIRVSEGAYQELVRRAGVEGRTVTAVVERVLALTSGLGGDEAGLRMALDPVVRDVPARVYRPGEGFPLGPRVEVEAEKSGDRSAPSEEPMSVIAVPRAVVTVAEPGVVLRSDGSGPAEVIGQPLVSRGPGKTRAAVLEDLKLATGSVTGAELATGVKPENRVAPGAFTPNRPSSLDHFDSRGAHTDVDAARGESDDFVRELTVERGGEYDQRRRKGGL